MKRQFKALTLALALLTTTACGSNEAKVSNQTRAGQSQVSESKELKVANVDTPKANAIETKKEDNRSYLIPQTVELEDKKESIVEDIKEANEKIEETTEVDIEEVNEEIIQIEEKPVEEVVVANEEEIAATEVDAVPETSESLALSNTVEETVVASTVATEIEQTVGADEVKSGLTISSPSAEEVKAYWLNYESQATETQDFLGLNLVDPSSKEAYLSAPNADLNNLNLGEVSNIAQEDALHIANTARFASGITNELAFGYDQAQFAQAAAMVNRLNLAVSHNPQLPAGVESDSAIYVNGLYGAENSNLAASFNILDSVVEYLKDDLGSENQLEVGHRRWILNPQASLIGFGQTDEFNAMFVNNNDYAGENANTVYAYPGETAISEFHSAGSSLSLMFGENFDLTNATVEVKDLATGEVNTAANIDESFKGNTKALTFGYGMNYEAGTKLEVKVSDVTKDGQEYPVEYTINYMSLR